MPTPPLRCLLCPRTVGRRGLCAHHYKQACGAVGSGQTTWAALEAAGKALPAVRSPWRGKRR